VLAFIDCIRLGHIDSLLVIALTSSWSIALILIAVLVIEIILMFITVLIPARAVIDHSQRAHHGG
jgi:hypothetical protein